jgi:hypothetical protein
VRIVELLLDALLNAIKDKHQELLVELLARAAKDGALPADDVSKGLATLTELLEDLRCGGGAGHAGKGALPCNPWAGCWRACARLPNRCAAWPAPCVAGALQHTRLPWTSAPRPPPLPLPAAWTCPRRRSCWARPWAR